MKFVFNFNKFLVFILLPITFDSFAMIKKDGVFVCSSCGAEHRRSEGQNTRVLSTSQKLKHFNNIYEELVQVIQQILKQEEPSNSEEFINLVGRLPEADRRHLLALFNQQEAHAMRSASSHYLDVGIDKLHEAVGYLKQRHQDLDLDTQT